MSLLWTSLVLLSLHCGQLCCALRTVQIHSIHVEYGKPATLPCNGSAWSEDEGRVLWEVMGEDVALLRGGELKEGDKFEGRVSLPSEEQIKEGDWSVVLGSTVVSDTNMYECILEGRETISTVWITVTVPHQRSIVVSAGDAVDLTCYYEIPDSSPVDDVQVRWTRNGSTIVEHIDRLSQRSLWLDTSERVAHLLIVPALTSDSGEYSCLYKTGDSASSIVGKPLRTMLTVLEPQPTDITGMTEAQTMVTTEETVTLLQEEGMTEAQTMVTTEETVTLLQDEGMTEAQTMVPTEETVTLLQEEAPLPSAPTTYQDVPETSAESFHWDAFQWDNFPWIRIGLISGVLLVTAVVLCVLKSLQKI